VAWKLVVVDNGSSDGSTTIINSFRDRLPIELIEQPLPGKSRALYQGISAAEGELVIITDDDAVPSHSFLKAWAKLLTSKTEYDLFGGAIEPWFEQPPPKWLLKGRLHFDLLFGERDEPEGPINPEGIFGCNMAVRMSIFNRGFRFDENIGPNWLDDNYPMGSETEFSRRVAHTGSRCWFAREPRVQHIVRPDQLTETSWTERAYRLGRGLAIWQGPHDHPQSGRMERLPAVERLSRLGRQAFDRLRWLKIFYPRPERRFESMIAYHIARGFNDQRNRLGKSSRHVQ
jgi:hypothetical protein